MNILVANDDGIRAIGIQKLVRALSQKANIFVCAPEGQRSASGHGITVSQPITVEEMKVECAEIAFGISGTPADCIKLGMQLMKDRGVNIDMVYSGINLGGNLGTEPYRQQWKEISAAYRQWRYQSTIIWRSTSDSHVNWHWKHLRMQNGYPPILCLI